MRKSETIHNDPWERDFYGTGSTRPPKQHGGLIAFLLVLVILLGGICSALGLLNLRLLQQLAAAQPDPDTLYLFGDGEKAGSAVPTDTVSAEDDWLPGLGARGQTVSEFDRRYYELPKGVLVTAVTEDRSAHRAGIRIGDVICALEGRDITTQEELESALNLCEPGQEVQVKCYRTQTGEHYHTMLTIPEEEKESLWN